MNDRLRLLALLLVDGNTATHFDPTDISPTDFQQMKENDANKKLYLQLRDLEENKYFLFDYGRAYTDIPDFQGKDTWAEVLILMGYNTLIWEGHITRSPYTRAEVPYSDVKIWDCMHTLNTFILDYGDGNSGSHGNYLNRFRMKDLYIHIQDGASEFPDLTQCVPVVNGFVCEPMCVNGDTSGSTIFARYGAQLCWQEGIHRTPEILLLDFSTLGGFEIRKFTFATTDTPQPNEVTVCSRTGEFSMNARWKIISDVSMEEYTPIVVLCGIAIFPDRIYKEGNNSFSFAPYQVPLNFSNAYRKYLTDESTPSGMVFHSKSIEDLYTSGDLIDQSFIIYVKTPYLYTIREYMDVWDNFITINNYTPDGILISNVTDTIEAYHRAQYSSHTELTLQNQESLFICDRAFGDDQFLFIPPDCIHHTSKNKRQSNCTMIYMLRG